MNRFFPRVFVRLLLAGGVFFFAGRLAAQNDASNSFCILPIYDALTSGVSDATLQTEMNKLEAQVGPPRQYFKIGFSHIFGGSTSGGNSARMAAANGLSVGFIIALQTHDTNSTTAAVAANDLRLYQWRLDGKTWKGVNTGTSANPVWSGTSPGSGVNPTNFSAAWSGWVQAQYTETYTFYTETDDGVRLYINNSAVINHFVAQGATELSGTVSLVAGQYYPITMQYFQGTGTAQAQLSWSSPSQPREIIPPNALFPALPTINWTNTAAGSSTWSTGSRRAR